CFRFTKDPEFARAPRYEASGVSLVPLRESTSPCGFEVPGCVALSVSMRRTGRWRKPGARARLPRAGGRRGSAAQGVGENSRQLQQGRPPVEAHHLFRDLVRGLVVEEPGGAGEDPEGSTDHRLLDVLEEVGVVDD